MAPPSRAEIIADPWGKCPFATVACFDPTKSELAIRIPGHPPRRELDTERTILFLEKLAKAGAPAVLIGASTGHGHLRTPEELERLFAAAADADLGNTLKIGLLRPEDGSQTNRRLVGVLDDLGYQIIYTRRGTNLREHASDERVAKNMWPIVDEAAKWDMAIGLYSISDVDGAPLTPEAAAILVRNERVGGNIVAIKVTEADYDASTARFLAHPDLKRLKIVQGWDPHIARALKEGLLPDGSNRCGVTSGTMSFAVYQHLHTFEAAQKGGWDEVAKAQSAVAMVFKSMQDDPKKFADLQRAKYLMGLGHPFTGTVNDEQVERVFTALNGLPRKADKHRLAKSMDLMGDGPYHGRLQEIIKATTPKRRLPS